MQAKTLIAINAAWATAVAGAFVIGKGASGEAVGTKGDQVGTVGAGATGVSALSAGGAPTAGSAKREAAAGTPGGPVTGENAESRMASALSDADPLRRKARISELLVNLTPEQVPGMLAAFENGERDDETNRLFRDFLYAWGRVGGGEAIAYMMDPESKRRDHYGGTSAIAGWAASDLLGAKDYVAGVESQHAREWLHYGVFREQMRSDLDGAIAYSEANGKSRARGRQMDMLRDEIFQREGLEGLAGWVEGIDHNDQSGTDLLSYKQYASSIALDRMAAEDPEVASEWIAENGDQPFVTADGLERAARRAAGEINEELDWLVALPDDVAQRRHAIGERFEDFIRDDFAAAGEWLASQPLGPAFDEAIQDYARSAARDDPEAALAWAQRISDPEIRASTEQRIQPLVRQG